MINEKPIIRSILDNDLYTFTVGELVFHDFPCAQVKYKFINRNEIPFPRGFDVVYREEIRRMAELALTNNEANWFIKRNPYMRPTYVEWLQGYRFNPDEVSITQDNDGYIEEEIYAPWYRGIMWEVPLLALKSELYFRMTGQKAEVGWMDKMEKKGTALQTAECHWIDFGTRRRFSFDIQDRLVQIMKCYRGFLGTSNAYLAYKHNVTSHGTYSHQGPMGVSALYGVRMANRMWMRHWSNHFDGNVGVTLTDTFTSESFWKDFGTYEARLFDGCRQDSGDPYKWGDDMVAHYRRLNIAMSNKRMVFSDNLTTDKYIALDKRFREFGQPCGGIGTHFTNDVGRVPLNMVIKLSSADFGHGPVDVVKLSDDISKATGSLIAIRHAKEELNIL